MQRRDGLAQQRTKVREFARDSIISLGKLERVVGLQAWAEALLSVKQVINAGQSLLTYVAPALGIAERGAMSVVEAAGVCVMGELVNFSGGTTASCTGDPAAVDGCVEDVVKNGELWAMKTAACVAEGTAKKLGNAAALMEIVDTQVQLNDVMERRDRTLGVMKDVVDNVQQFADRLDRLRDSTAIIDATIGPLERLCRSPKLAFVTTDVKSTMP